MILQRHGVFVNFNSRWGGLGAVLRQRLAGVLFVGRETFAARQISRVDQFHKMVGHGSSG
jgi:hypothetical protein